MHLGTKIPFYLLNFGPTPVQKNPEELSEIMISLERFAASAAKYDLKIAPSF